MQKQAIPALRFPEFNENWNQLRLGDIGKVSMCKRIMKDETSTSGDIPFYKIGTFGKEPDAYIDKKIYEKYKQKYSFPQKGDILVSASGTIGRLVVYDGLPAYFQDSNIIWIANDEKTITNPFLSYCYKNVQWTTEDTTIARLYNDNLKKVKIYIPQNQDEQKKIAEFLGAIDEKIAQLQKKKDLLENYKKGCMQKLFSQEIRFTDDNGNPFPDWEEQKLGDIATFKKGKGISKADISEDGEYKCIRYGELYTEYKAFIDLVKSRTNVDMINPVLSKKNDILMPTSDVTPNGLATASAIDEKDVILGGDILIIRAKELNNRYFSYFVDGNKHMIMRLVSGVTVYHIYGSDMATLKLTLPHINEQKKIADFLSTLDDKIALVADELDKAKTFKKGLLQQMFV